MKRRYFGAKSILSQAASGKAVLNRPATVLGAGGRSGSRSGLPHGLRPGLRFSLILALILWLGPAVWAAWPPEDARYAGSPACASCHRTQFDNFQALSKKAVTRRQVEKLLPKLSGEEQTTCFRCHATGYGKPGGFVSYAQTPGLGDVGCESCHGPGSAHIEAMSGEAAAQSEPEGARNAQNPQNTQAGRPANKLITRQPAPEACAACHTPARGGVKPLYGGAH